MEIAPDIRLKLSACTTPAQLATVLENTQVDPATVLALVPEAFDPEELAHLLPPLGGDHTAACIRRAEAIEQWTGRIDWAITWLHSVGQNAGVCAALRNAQMAWLAGVPLAELNGMHDTELVSWAVARSQVLDTLCSSIGELRSAWNAWWLEHPGLPVPLVRKYPGLFDAPVVLAAAYSADIGDAQSLLGGLAESLKVGVSDSVELPAETFAKLKGLEPSGFASLSMSEIPVVVGAGLAQVGVAEMLSGLSVDMASILLCQNSIEDQKRLLVRLVSSQRRALWPDLVCLHRVGLFGLLSLDTIKKEYLRVLLGNEQIEQAQRLIHEEPRLSEAMLRDAVCQAAREMFDNAESGDSGLIGAAQRCLDILPAADAEAARERALVEAARLVCTLGGFGHRGEVLPIEIRLATDPHELIRDILRRSRGGYKKQRVVREIHNKLLEASNSQPISEARDLSIHTISEALVAALLLEAATNACDLGAAFDFARQLVNARPMLGKVAAPRREHLLGAGSRETRAIEFVCTVCVRLASRSELARERRLEVAALALSLCPTDEIPRTLRLWNNIQAELHEGSAPGDPVFCVREALFGQIEQAGAMQAALCVEPTAVRTFDAAIIKRCLRVAKARGAKDRRELLMEWLEFALTTIKEPTSRDAAFRRRVEADIIKRYPSDACGVLVSRVLPELDQTNYGMLEAAYGFYVRCLHSMGSPSEEQQMSVRLELIRGIRGSASLKDVDFEELIGVFVSPKAECRERSKRVLRPDTVGELVELAPQLFRLGQPPGTDEAARWGSADELGSKLCLWVLVDTVERGAPDVAPSVQFSDMLGGCIPLISEDDAASLACFAAFGATAARVLDLSSRSQCVAMCQQRAETHSDILKASAYMDFVLRVHSIRDPFTFAAMPEQWALLFDVFADIRNGGSLDASEVGSALAGVLSEMIAAGTAAYFVCESYVCIRELAARWSGLEIPELSDVYAKALFAEARGGARLADIAEPPLELSGFAFGDSELGSIMARFRQSFATVLRDVVHDKHKDELGGTLDSAAKLVLLEIVGRHCMDTGDTEIGVGEKAVDADNTKMDCLQFRLLADKHWGRKVEVSGADWHALWLELLAATDPHDDNADTKIDALVVLLERWTAGGTDECVAALIGWAVRSERPNCLLCAMADHPRLFTTAAGRAFDALIDEAQSSPCMVPALAVLALVYPEKTWAEQCMGLVVHVMLSAPAQPDASSDNDNEEDNAWGIDDVVLDSNEAELLRASHTVLESPTLHVAIAACGFVPACLASPPLLDALGQTVLRAAQGREPALKIPGLQSAKLFHRVVHTVFEVGMHVRALEWIYQLLDVPLCYRFAARKRTAGLWLGHVDSWLLGLEERDGAVSDAKDGWDEVELGNRADVDEHREDEADGWGDEDIDLDADLENI
ncbi:hypothetical protein GGI25_004326 [Coemansia spiralis]|uniref:Sec39 domain-containing protein n=2 Tax=Coemansia TaxID=4863 RepID=A0A9W8KXB0_9FUNG|nr:hypothetical protein EDC05_003832 [Coemansia umbellata]KAJ2622639.1 hypothetical protein GGI26_003085 [Coemansia sp. RSA 1358]KAJ2674587.1 hypothetical protein GGI25_004326 [Coemansia spiralis]